jgi:hypothetical protein
MRNLPLCGLFSLVIVLFLSLQCSSVEIADPVSQPNVAEAELSKLLEQVAGIYRSPPPNAPKNLQKTVIVTACNYGFLNHLYNFDCFMRRLNYKYLVIAMDQKAYNYLKSNTSIVTHYMPSETEITTQPQEFRSKHFNIITSKKKEAVLNIMKLGYNVVFSDTDVAIIRDPMPYMVWDNVDYVHSLNAMCKV